MDFTTAGDLGLIVRARRAQLEWSQETLAQAAGVSPGWIAELESGTTRAELDLVLRTVDALGFVLHLSAREHKPDDGVAPLVRINLDELLAQHRDAAAQA
jgi:HTH-type transcriptional regulator/antitoxin HipB